jgi:RHS repeat-associated protein
MGWVNSLLIDRGYTGHEHLYTVGLIHMNGRIYDPILRQFMSPDNYVQDPYNTQNFNRFGYVLNNPLLYTDPSGEFIPLLLGAIGVSILTKAISNLINGIPWWHGLGKAATMGAINAVISFGIGDIASSAFSNYWSQAALKAGLHAFKSGTLSAIEGGNFGSGFFSGAIASMAMSSVGKFGLKSDPIVQGNKTMFETNNFGNTATFKAIMLATGATAGGISSSLAGGDFWMGVREGLISGGCNELMHVIYNATIFDMKNGKYRVNYKQLAKKLAEQDPSLNADELKAYFKKHPITVSTTSSTLTVSLKGVPYWVTFSRDSESKANFFVETANLVAEETLPGYSWLSDPFTTAADKIGGALNLGQRTLGYLFQPTPLNNFDRFSYERKQGYIFNITASKFMSLFFERSTNLNLPIIHNNFFNKSVYDFFKNL